MDGLTKEFAIRALRLLADDLAEGRVVLREISVSKPGALALLHYATEADRPASPYQELGRELTVEVVAATAPARQE